MNRRSSELDLEQGRRVFLSADYHLLPKVEPESLKDWARGFERGDVCIFLGDLYEAWVETHQEGRPGYEALHGTIREMVDRGVETHLVVGNRDFLAGDACHQATGMIIHHGPLLIRSGGASLALFHGDELLPDDVGYLRYKAIVRNPLVLALLKKLPLSLLMTLAEGTRSRSKAKLKNLPMDRFTPSIELIRLQLAKWDVKLAVAGHLHKKIWVEGGGGLGCHVLSSSSEKEIFYRIWKGGELGDEQAFKPLVISK